MKRKYWSLISTLAFLLLVYNFATALQESNESDVEAKSVHKKHVEERKGETIMKREPERQILVQREELKNREEKEREEKQATLLIQKRSIPLLTEDQMEKNMKSQFGEDKYVFERYFRNPLKLNGTFLEVGALDGVLYSNTYFFEKILGWDGILIEPTPHRAKELMQKRNASYMFEGAVCEQRKRVKMITSGLDAVNGNLEHMSEEFIKKFHSKPFKEEFEVECNTLSHYINQTPIKHINFMIIDVEGMELPALQGYDWSITFDVLAIEISEPDLPKNHVIKSMLREKGYIYQERKHLSEIWAKDSFLQSLNLA